MDKLIISTNEEINIVQKELQALIELNKKDEAILKASKLEFLKRKADILIKLNSIPIKKLTIRRFPQYRFYCKDCNQNQNFYIKDFAKAISHIHRGLCTKNKEIDSLTTSTIEFLKILDFQIKDQNYEPESEICRDEET